MEKNNIQKKGIGHYIQMEQPTSAFDIVTFLYENSDGFCD